MSKVFFAVLFAVFVTVVYMTLPSAPERIQIGNTGAYIEVPAGTKKAILDQIRAEQKFAGVARKGDRLPLKAAAARTFTPSGIEEDNDADIHDEEIKSLPPNTTMIAKK